MPSMRGRLQKALSDVDVQVISTKKDDDGKLVLEMPTAQVASVTEAWAYECEKAEEKIILILHYAKFGPELPSTIAVWKDMGFSITDAMPGLEGWPTSPARFDDRFQMDLLAKTAKWAREQFPIALEEAPLAKRSVRDGVMFELLRGLITHSKMGPNNHSHEDDFWKERGLELRPKEQHSLLMEMLAARLISRKKNDSAGGKGWVYWVDDVTRARQRFPELNQYFNTTRQPLDGS